MIRSGWIPACGILLVLAACGPDSPTTPATSEAPDRAETGAGAVARPPADAGAVEGRVHLVGRAPGNRVIRMGVDPKCAAINRGRMVVDAAVAAASDGALANVFLHLEGDLPALPPPAEPVRIGQEGCMYIPRVVGVQVGQALEIRNNEDVAHNLHAFSGAGNGFNRGQPQAGMVFEFRPEAPEIMLRLGCDIHRWMTSYIGIVEHPYFDVSAPEGAFRIPDVPAGVYTLHAWHEVYGEVSFPVEVRAGETAVIDVEYSVEGAG